MGKGRPRAVERGGLGQSSNASSTGSLNLPLAPVYYPSEEEFKDPLEFLEKIRAEAEPYGICKIVPPENWKPPFALDLDSFTFPTKTQAIHQLQVRPASCDSKTFDLEYDRFLEANGGKRPRSKVVFEGEDLDFCKLFNAVKRHGGYDKVVREKKWAEVFRFVRQSIKISECAKHVLSQLYREHLYDYERHYNKLNNGKSRSCRKRTPADKKADQGSEFSDSKRRRNNSGESIKVSSAQEFERDQICENCKSGLHGEVMLLCDRCNKGWHIYCLSPPLESIPSGNWYCFECLNSDEDAFGFVPGKKFSLESFRKVADRTKRKWFGSASCSRTQMEKKFWEIVEGSLGEVEVMYGSDLDTSIYGSGFPRLHDPKPESLEDGLWDQYCVSPWNLNNLPKLKGSMLRAVHHNIAGVMVPWLYIGMLFSAFCWHFEDHCFYSMNYHHWGEPKCWYSVPGSEASSFEKVMRNCLPDLFDAQPDLLFQLVTMLNPSVLQDNGVPVYTVLQEPGNFVITFPRSYHGGFNLGLNCAEAVNFAPADWLPHGGFGVELYQLYHKAAVLSHEELLCVVAKSDLDSNVAPYINKELQRIFSKEKTWREQLWKKGVVKTSIMSPRKHPEYVGTEEDPTCIICEQYLYLSAVGCRCRPKTFVCLEHWERLCECNPRKRRLLYRHSLAEMKELLVITDDHQFKEMRQSRCLRRQNSLCNSVNNLKKKVKGKNVSFSQLAEQWLLSSLKLLQLPFSGEAYGKSIRQAGQFLWAGPEMDAVRELVKNLAEAKHQAESVHNCLFKLENWPDGSHSDSQKMQLEHVFSLLAHDSSLCNEPGHLKLKEYADAAVALVHDIHVALSKLPVSISQLENVHKRATEFPIHVKEAEELSHRISLIKVWTDNVRKCALNKFPAAVDIDALVKLKEEMLELQLAFPESEMLMALIENTECCQARCSDILKSCITLKDVELLIQDYESFPVDIPELKLLRKHYSDAVSWISRFNQVVSDTEDPDGLDIAILELNSLKEDSALLNVQVDECDRVDIELKRMHCRRKASEARTTKKPLDLIMQVLAEAVELQIEEEGLFLHMSEVFSSAICWEEQAKHTLFTKGSICDYESSIRASVDIHAILPSLPDVEDALSTAKLWLQTSEPFLQAVDSNKSDTSLLTYEALKEHYHQSTLLRVSLAECMVIEMLLKRCEEWRCRACGILKDVDEMVDSQINGNEIMDALVLNIGQLITNVERVTADGFSFGFKFPETSDLEAAHSTLQWCFKVTSFFAVVAPYKEIISLYEAARDLPSIYSSSFLLASLLDGVTWLKRASEILSLTKGGVRTFYLADAEDALADSQQYAISFSLMIEELDNAIRKHKGWLQKVHLHLRIDSTQRPWSSFLQLKELGETDAFSCSELNTIISEYKEIEKWKLCCEELVVDSRDEDSLVNSLLKIKKSLHRSMYIYEKLSGGNSRYYCTGCSNRSDEEDFTTCSFCNDWYHNKCLVPKDAEGDIVKNYTCPYCLLVQNGSIRHSRDSPMKYEGKRPKLVLLIELLSDAQKFCVWVEEKKLLQEIVDQTLACRKCLTEIVDSALACTDRDVSSISQRLTIPLKALDVVGVYDPLSREKFDKALARNSWRVRALKLLEGSQKPLMQQLQHHLKEASTIDVPSEDYFRQKLLEVNQIGLEWAETAKKVAGDDGELPLDQVFDLIIEGQNLPVRFEKELKMLRERSTLYCICRKPYDNSSAMIACDHCQEWYHFDCVNVPSPVPKVYTCPACDTLQLDKKGCFSSYIELEGLVGAKTSEPKTPSPRHIQSLWKHNKKPHHKLSKQLKTGETGSSSYSSKQTSSTGVGDLFWSNRRPYSRLSKKRIDLGSLASF